MKSRLLHIILSSALFFAGVNVAMADNLGEAINAYHDGRYEQALEILQPLAKQRNTGAQFYLALMYNNGQGVEADIPTTIKWLKKAARAGHAKSIYLLGKFHAAGRGVEQDTGKTRRLWIRAGNKGELEAQTGLAQFYASGGAMKRAVKWWRMAAKQGDAESQYWLGLMYSQGKGGLRKHSGHAKSWWRKAAAQGHEQAQAAL